MSQIRNEAQVTVQSPAMPSTTAGQAPTALPIIAPTLGRLEVVVTVSISPMLGLVGLRRLPWQMDGGPR